MGTALCLLCAGVGYLGHRYFKQNDAETYLTHRHHPRTGSLLTRLYVIDPNIESKYKKYDYMLYAARFAAAVLSNKSYYLEQMSDFLSLLNDVILVAVLHF